jgi:hypothetical protein
LEADADVPSASGRLGIHLNGLGGSSGLDEEIAQGPEAGSDEGMASPTPRQGHGDPDDTPVHLEGSIYVS